jgi:hypothetical protein
MQSLAKISAGLAAALLLAACDGPDDPIPVLFDPIEPRASVRFFHAVPDAPDVNITVGGIVAAGGLKFGEATSFSALASGTQAVTVNAILPGGTAAVIGPADIDFDVTNDYTIIAAGEVDQMGVPIAPIVIANPESSVTPGNARVEVVHAAPNAGDVDIYVTLPGTNLMGEMPIVGGSTPFGANSGQIEVAAGDYQVRVTAPGSTMPLFDSGTITLADGADLMVVALDNTGPGTAPITLSVSPGIVSFEILDVATPADVRVVHAVPNAPAVDVDVYVNDPMAAGAPAIAGLSYGNAAPGTDAYVSLTAGTNNVLVTEAGNTGFLVIPAVDLELAAGQQYTVYATGTVGGGIEALITEDDDRSVGTESRVRILHLSPSAGLVDIYVTAPGVSFMDVDPTFAGVDFRQETGYVSLAEGSYDVTVTLADSPTVAIGPVTIPLAAGGVYTAAARDPDPNIVNDPFGLILLDDF